MKQWLNDIYHSFPVQLTIMHLRSNLILVTIWVSLVLFITGILGGNLGFPSLFLDPEYFGRVGFVSFFIVGAAYGLFFMSWNLATYLLTVHQFPFLASLARPFTKFCINNFIIPATFVLFYLTRVTYFQSTFGRLPPSDIMLYTLGFMLGILTSLILYALYFQFTNKDISSYKKRNRLLPHLIPGLAPSRPNIDIDYIKQPEQNKRVKIYLNEFMRPKIVRSVAHYESSFLRSIFKQNHLNALLFQLLTVFILILLGLLIDYPASRIPAGASILILLSILIAFIGAISYWFGEWNVIVFIVVLLLINHLTSFDFFHRDNLVYGLDYSVPATKYNAKKLKRISDTGIIEEDIAATQTILDNWRKINDPGNGEKPKLTILCVSGGGLKAAAWAFRNIQLADSLTQGRFLHSNVLITGASGGMLGAAYLRELYLRKQKGDLLDLYSQAYLDNITKDLLNSVSFTWVANDLFLPFAKFKSGEQTYYKDRGYIFERQFNENTDFVLQKKLADYQQPEAEGIIPMMYITPSIINDARRLIISPQGVSFMMLAPAGLQLHGEVDIDAVDFGWLFAAHNPGALHFTSALRMNATYPYVLPNAHLPSSPEIQVIDAGFRDNFGVLSATRFLQTFKAWILENTSGVVLVQINSAEKTGSILPNRNQGTIERLIEPLGLMGLMFTVQGFEQDNNLGFVMDLLGRDHFELVRFNYTPLDAETPSPPVSFHISALEKKNLLDAIQSEENQRAMQRLMELLSHEKIPAAGK
ncbi:MAG: patatin-like phospholipase family protein [Lewinellaceae bacterium]|nr:patatin-like phospholipase family protein [Lewinellaceae bacterium]